MNARDGTSLRPVTLLTGFLGSGKTTTLARLLKAPEFAGTIAIINEFGEIGLDHLLVETTEERLALLDNGCICCTVREDLVEMLLRLAARAEAGELPDFRRVVIETTGLADPAPILHALMAQQRLAECYRIDGVLATVDAVNGLSTLKAQAEAVKQVAVADRLLLTKTDIVTETTLTPLLDRLATLNPAAQIIFSREGDAPAAALVELGLDALRGEAGDIVDWFSRAAHAIDRSRFRAEAHDECRDPGCRDPRHGVRHDQGVSTFSITIEQPVAWGDFKQWLEYLSLLRGEDLLRFKGLVHIAERPDNPMVVHGVQHVFHPARELAAWPSEDRRTRLIFITRGISRTIVESTLSKFAAIDLARMHRPAA
jgi:G3E family GTPase